MNLKNWFLQFSYNKEMSLTNIFGKIFIFIPICIGCIVLIDLLKNRSVFTQYIHWVSYSTATIVCGLLTGKSFYFTINKESNFQRKSEIHWNVVSFIFIERLIKLMTSVQRDNSSIRVWHMFWITSWSNTKQNVSKGLLHLHFFTW